MNKYRQLKRTKHVSGESGETPRCFADSSESMGNQQELSDINTSRELAEIFSVTTDYLLNVDSSKLKRQ